MLNMYVLVRKNNRGVTVMVTRSLWVKDLEILRALVFINFEEKVWLCLNLSVNILSKALLLLTLELLLEA